MIADNDPAVINIGMSFTYLSKSHADRSPGMYSMFPSVSEAVTPFKGHH